MLQIHGVPFSPHTRKVVWTALEKGLPYEIVPVIPVNPPPGWAKLSPLGKIPVLRTGTVDVVDSSVICQYLERLHPAPALYPAEPSAFARTLWLEEFVDGGLAPHVAGLVRERVFASRFLGRAPDEAVIKRLLENEIPPKLAYLEGALEGDYAVGTALTIADLTVASMLLNFTYAGERLAPYPRLERHVRARLRDPKARAMKAWRRNPYCKFMGAGGVPPGTHANVTAAKAVVSAPRKDSGGVSGGWGSTPLTPARIFAAMVVSPKTTCEADIGDMVLEPGFWKAEPKS